MKRKFFMGILALMMIFLALPGAVSAADVTVSGSIVKPDLTVTAISPNVGVGAFIFANEPNVISVTVQNSGTAAAGASTLSVDIGGTVYTTAVGALAIGASSTVSVTDTVSHVASPPTVTILATADSTAAIDEGNEDNNAMTSVQTVYNNGYKGKRWTGGADIVTTNNFDGRDNVIYSSGNSAYNSASWTTKTYTWSSTDLPVPAGATVLTARLYQPYNWNKMGSPEGSQDPAWTMSFNGATVTPGATYKDRKSFGSYDYPYGLYVYDVTSTFNKAGNTITITPESGNNYAIMGSYIVVVYQDPATTVKKIWLNEGYDNLQAYNAYSVSEAEATAFAPFSDVDTTSVASAKVINILFGASDASKSKFFFNGNEYTGFWSGYSATTQNTFKEYDVLSVLANGANTASMQSVLNGATSGDGFAPMNAILVVEKTETPVTLTSLGAVPTSGDSPLEITFTPVTTGSVVSYAWIFEGTPGTDYVFLDSTSASSQNPKVRYLNRGTYDVSLTVTGIGSGNTASLAQTDYITIREPAPVVDFSGTPTSGTSPLAVSFTATNTGGAATSYDWTFGDGQTQTTTVPTVSHTYSSTTAQTYTVSLIAHGPDYNSATVTKPNYVSVGAQTIDVSVTSPSIAFGTMSAGVDATGNTGVAVDVTGGTAWSVTAAANNGGFMKDGLKQLAAAFQLANGVGTPHEMNTDFTGFMTGAANEDRTDTANVRQVIATGDQPGSYSITMTFTGAFV